MQGQQLSTLSIQPLKTAYVSKTRQNLPHISLINKISISILEFPAGILQEAFFDADRPRYMNYGAIGFVIGHEITHGFDDQGRQFDLRGNLVDWWAAPTKQQYLEKARCIIEQYGNYTEREVGLKVNDNKIITTRKKLFLPENCICFDNSSSSE